jgi:signal peptidase I
MIPTLANGHLIVYHGISQQKIQNGTIIVYLSSQTGFPALDSMVRPVIIHRVVGEVVQSDGTIYYRTKGDNNQFPDQALVRYDQILGTPTEEIPMVGAVVLFIKSPQGLVFIVAALTLLYFNRFDRAISRDKRRKEVLSTFAKSVLDGGLSMEEFEKARLAIDFTESLPQGSPSGQTLSSLTEWLMKGSPTSERKNIHSGGIEREARRSRPGENRLLHTLRITRALQHRQPRATVGRESKKERSIVRAALSVIKRHGGAVTEDEMLRETYMELLQRKIDFESMRELEQTLLQHTNQELQVTSQDDKIFEGRKWWSATKKRKPTSSHEPS